MARTSEIEKRIVQRLEEQRAKRAELVMEHSTLEVRIASVGLDIKYLEDLLYPKELTAKPAPKRTSRKKKADPEPSETVATYECPSCHRIWRLDQLKTKKHEGEVWYYCPDDETLIEVPD
jgi:predicted RNA-binding Zn-ribbon protein involved in translation (DUF1610 family)